MSSTITLEGLLTVGGAEDRALADIKVEYKNNTYMWKIYVPQNAGDLAAFLEQSKPFIEADIDAKEAQWAALDPKTRTVEDPISREPYTVDIQKDEIVCPSIPDYYALRRVEYPPIGEQLDAFWKGPDSQAYLDILQKIQHVKQKYPKPTF